jgi:hypothetical protein
MPDGTNHARMTPRDLSSFVVSREENRVQGNYLLDRTSNVLHAPPELVNIKEISSFPFPSILSRNDNEEARRVCRRRTLESRVLPEYRSLARRRSRDFPRSRGWTWPRGYLDTEIGAFIYDTHDGSRYLFRRVFSAFALLLAKSPRLPSWHRKSRQQDGRARPMRRRKNGVEGERTAIRSVK